MAAVLKTVLPQDQVIFTAAAAALFLVISSPKLYELTSRLAPQGIALTRPGWQPTAAGLVLHTAVFAAVVYGVSYYQHYALAAI